MLPASPTDSPAHALTTSVAPLVEQQTRNLLPIDPTTYVLLTDIRTCSRAHSRTRFFLFLSLSLFQSRSSVHSLPHLLYILNHIVGAT
jgi:hypothetical protein